VQSLAFPLSLPVFVGYILAGNPSVFFDVLAYVPLTAPLAMPVLVGLGAVAWWQVAVSAVISIVCTVAVAKAAADGSARCSLAGTDIRAALDDQRKAWW